MKKNHHDKKEEEWEDVYTFDGIQELIDNDEVNIEEAGFISGYLIQDEDDEEEEM